MENLCKATANVASKAKKETKKKKKKKESKPNNKNNTLLGHPYSMKRVTGSIQKELGRKMFSIIQLDKMSIWTLEISMFAWFQSEESRVYYVHTLFGFRKERRNVRAYKGKHLVSLLLRPGKRMNKKKEKEKKWEKGAGIF
eukprot:TRINITY_DN3313_c1_g1_i2.p1 TRINITY_DN3313_c1_g1~~TRINITY_DN3313_c1_g1_i2.p1  ORF type:complete len:141 (-),score=8.97 TRINITY_DN3313_c1_g1_i2:805-1227(-)